MQLYKNYLSRISVIFMLFASSRVLADTVSSNVMTTITFLGSFISSISMIIGFGCLFGSLVQYRLHRQNPLQATWATIITLFIMGVVLIALPFLNRLSSSGVAYFWT